MKTKDILFVVVGLLLALSISFNFCSRKNKIIEYKVGETVRDTVYQKDTLMIKSTKFVTKFIPVNKEIIIHDTLLYQYDTTDRRVNLSVKTQIKDTLQDSTIFVTIIDTLSGACRLDRRDFYYKLKKPITITSNRVDTIQVSKLQKPKLKDKLKTFGYGALGGAILTLLILIGLQ